MNKPVEVRTVQASTYTKLRFKIIEPSKYEFLFLDQGASKQLSVLRPAFGSNVQNLAASAAFRQSTLFCPRCGVCGSCSFIRMLQAVRGHALGRRGQI